MLPCVRRKGSIKFVLLQTTSTYTLRPVHLMQVSQGDDPAHQIAQAQSPLPCTFPRFGLDQLIDEAGARRTKRKTNKAKSNYLLHKRVCGRRCVDKEGIKLLLRRQCAKTTSLKDLTTTSRY
ncbi:hypothetical protein J3E69DRAFT_140111 [Trichoderma sp. SZMC 28015]